MSIKKTKPIALTISLLLLFFLSATKTYAGITANCSATKASPTCSVKFTQSRSDGTVITTANAGETKGLWLTIAGYNPAYHTAYYVCENSGDPVLKVLPGAANQADTGADWTFANAGKERCYLVFFPVGTTPAADWSNATSSCQTGYVTVSVPSAPTCTASFSPTSLTAPGTSNLTFNSSGADKLLGSCTGPLPIPQGDYGLMSTSAYPFAFTATQIDTETCSFTPYNGATKGTACSASVVVTTGSVAVCGNGRLETGEDCDDKSPFSGGTVYGCPSGQTCNSSCKCVTCNKNCSCASSTCSGSTCSDGCGGTCAGTKTDGTCATTGCGTQAGATIAYGSLSATSPNLCTAGSSAVNGFRTWCGLYDWHCGSSTAWCNAYTQGVCGSVSGTTVTNGSLTTNSPDLCKNNAPSYFANTGSVYTWKCGKDGCGDERSETNGVVSCQATIGTSQYSCTGTLPTSATKCSGSDSGLTANTPWKSVGTSASSCTGGKCEYYTGSSCNWSLALGANPASGQAPLTSTLTATTQQAFGGETYIYSNQSCGSPGPTPTNVNGASFTCVYPLAGTYYPSITTKAQSTGCTNNATATVTVAASSFSCTGTLPTGSTKCEGDDTGLTSSIAWQSVGTSASSCTTARKCEYYTSGTSCDLTASLTAVPTTGSAPFKTDLSAFAQTSSVPLHCSSQDCGGGTVSNIINECKFSCTYNNNGTYVPKVHVTNPNCFKDPTASVVVTGGSPACAATTCIGNSCWDGTKYISGTKTQNCATGSAIADPATLIVPNTSYIKWNSNGASKLDFACAGPISTTRGGWYLNDAACKNSGAVKECTDKGYGMAFAANQTGTEICVFYPYNTSDGQIGTPFTVAITSNSGTNTNNGKCGTAAKTYSSTDTNWGNYTFCETGQVNPAAPTFPTVGNSTAWNCKSANGGVDGNCTASRSTNAANSSQTICKPDNANCAKETCNKYYCWDGCAYLKGTGGCN